MTRGKTRPRTIDAIYAWVATNRDGSEGIVSTMMGDTHMPLIGADVDRMKALRSAAEYIRQASGCPVRLVRFSHREDMEVLP